MAYRSSKAWMWAGSLSMVGAAVSCLAVDDAPGGSQRPAEAVVSTNRTDVHARIERREWKAGETPAIVLDLRLGKTGSVAVARMPYCEIEVDGVWYVSRMLQPVAGYIQMGAGQTWNRYTAVRLDPAIWTLKPDDARRKHVEIDTDPAKRLNLPAGKHVVHVACNVGGGRIVSNAVEVVVNGPIKPL